MAQVTLGYPWTDPDGVEHEPDETLDVDDTTADQLIRDGVARAAVEAYPDQPATAGGQVSDVDETDTEVED